MAKRRNKTHTPAAAQPSAAAGSSLEDAQAATTAIVPIDAPALDPELVTIVFQRILLGRSEQDVRDYIERKLPGVPADALILAAVKRFAEAGEFQPEIMYGWCAEAYREIYRVAMESGDMQVALRAVKQLAQLAGYK